jgi:hypothetical protein
MRDVKCALLLLCLAGFLPTPVLAHPGTGIVVDRLGQIYFVDMVSGVWRLDAHGALTHMPGPAFHWLALDASNRFAATRLPTGPTGDIARLGSDPTLLLASDVPIAMGPDGSLYFPSHGSGPVVIQRLTAAGGRSTVASLRGPIRDLNGLAVGPDGSIYYTENDAVRRVSPEGKTLTIAEHISIAGCPATRAGGGPLLRGLDVDRTGTIYVAATACRGVIEISPRGRITVLPQLVDAWSPTGVVLSGSELFVLEYADPDTDDRARMLPRIRKIVADGSTAVVVTLTHH